MSQRRTGNLPRFVLVPIEEDKEVIFEAIPAKKLPNRNPPHRNLSPPEQRKRMINEPTSRAGESSPRHVLASFERFKRDQQARNVQIAHIRSVVARAEQARGRAEDLIYDSDEETDNCRLPAILEDVSKL